MLLSVNREIFWNLCQWQFLPFCCWKLMQLLFFVLFFFFLPSNPFGSLCPLCRGRNVHCVCAICSEKTLSKSESCGTSSCMPCHSGPGNGNTGIWDVWLWAPSGLLPWSHLVFPPGDDEAGFWRVFECRWQKECNGSSQGAREGQGGVPPGRVQGSMRKGSKVQNAADFSGGPGMGKLKVTVITLPESLSWPENSIYKLYKLKWELLLCSESLFHKVIRISNRSASC